MPASITPSSDEFFYGVQKNRPHHLPAREHLEAYSSDVEAFLGHARDVGKIQSSTYPQLLGLIARGAELCRSVFIKYTPGQFDTDALAELQSLSCQYGLLNLSLNGYNAAGMSAPICRNDGQNKQVALTAELLLNRTFKNSLPVLAEAFYRDVLNWLPVYCDGKIPTGNHSEFIISAAICQAYEACLSEILAPLPCIVNEAHEVRSFADRSHKTTPRPKPQDEGRSGMPRKEVRKDRDDERANLPDRSEVSRQTRFDTAMQEVSIAHETARMERQELIGSVRGRTKLYGGLRPNAGDEEKLEAAQILMQTVKQGIALMQITNAEHPAFNAEAIKRSDQEFASTLKLYTDTLPNALWSLVKIARKSEALMSQMTPETKRVVGDLIEQHTEVETYKIKW